MQTPTARSPAEEMAVKLIATVKLSTYIICIHSRDHMWSNRDNTIQLFT